MGSGDRAQVAGRPAARAAARPRRPATAAEVAWLAFVPCALVTLLAALALGPALGRLLPDFPGTAWPGVLNLRPEPTEHGRYLVLVLAPLLLTAAIALGQGRLRVGPSIGRWVAAVQLAGALFLVACLVLQRLATFGPLYSRAGDASFHAVYFTLPTLAVACAVAGVVSAAVRDRGTVQRIGSLLRETPRRRTVAWIAVALMAALSVLPALELEGTVVHALEPTRYHLNFPLDETYAVLDGRSPLVDFAAQYASLWPYALGAAMWAAGDSVGAFTTLTSLLTALALVSVFAVLRRVLASSLAALLLFLPLLATSAFMMEGTSVHRFSLATLLGTFPLRLAGPCFLLLLVARHLDGARPRGRVALFAAAGLVVLNNVDFGVPALAATLAALLWSGERLTPRALARLAGEALAGALAAYAAVAALTLLRAGALPDLGLLVHYARLFTGAGFGMLPVKPLVGVSTIIYLTYVAALATATVRALGGAQDRLLTGLLAWSGVFGIGLGAYYVGRSHPQVLIDMFPAWAFSLALLVALAVRELAGRGRLPSPAEAMCLVGFGVLVCSLAQTPTPWSQAARLRETTSRTLSRPGEERFVADRTRDGEPVLILSTLGHRLAARAGVVNVSPYTGEDSMPMREQLEEALAALRRAGGHKLFLPLGEPWPEIHAAVEAAGFRSLAFDEGAGLAEFSDRP